MLVFRLCSAPLQICILDENDNLVAVTVVMGFPH
jgi:hypothetical protein